MANLGFTVNAEDLPQDQGSFDPIPAGDYTVRVAEATLQQTKAGTGQYIKLRLDVIAPSHQGRVLFTNLNIQNANPKAEEIGRQQLGSIMRAINLPSIQDTDQLVGGVMNVKVTIKQDEQYGPSNEVKTFKAAPSAAASMPKPSQPAAQPQPQAAAPGTPPPWMNKG